MSHLVGLCLGIVTKQGDSVQADKAHMLVDPPDDISILGWYSVVSIWAIKHDSDPPDKHQT